jgi:hypothetical protein
MDGWMDGWVGKAKAKATNEEEGKMDRDVEEIGGSRSAGQEQQRAERLLLLELGLLPTRCGAGDWVWIAAAICVLCS